MREPGEHRGRRAEATVQQQQRFENMFCVRVDYRLRQERERLSLLFPPKASFCANKWMRVTVIHVCLTPGISGYVSASWAYFRLLVAWWHLQTCRREMPCFSSTSGQLSAHLWPGNFLCILHCYRLL